MLEAWRKVFREGVAPSITTPGLRAIQKALMDDDPRLTQGCTTSPPPLQAVMDWPVEGACLVGYAGWQGEGLETVGEVEEYFARTCNKADRLLGETAGCRFLLNWFDDTPRTEMRRELLGEVDLILFQRITVGEGDEDAARRVGVPVHGRQAS